MQSLQEKMPVVSRQARLQGEFKVFLSLLKIINVRLQYVRNETAAYDKNRCSIVQPASLMYKFICRGEEKKIYCHKIQFTFTSVGCAILTHYFTKKTLDASCCRRFLKTLQVKLLETSNFTFYCNIFNSLSI